MRKLFIIMIIMSIFCSSLLFGCSGTGFEEITSTAVADTFDTAERYSSVRSISAEQVSSLKSDMTYKEIINTLGDTTDFGRMQTRFYYVDNCGVLILSFEDENDVCTLSGTELLDTVINLDYQGKEFDSTTTKYGYIISNKKSNFFICCENNIIEGYYLGVTESTEITYANGNKAEESDLCDHYALITWDWIAESYPAQLSCTNIVICG